GRYTRWGRRPSGHETLPTLRTPARDAADDSAQAPHAATCAALRRGAHAPRFRHLVQRVERALRWRRPQRSHRLGGSLHREAVSTSTGWRGVAGAGRGGGCAWEEEDGNALWPSADDRLDRSPVIVPFHDADCHPALNVAESVKSASLPTTRFFPSRFGGF
ncbi:hypothetical protein T484DRAFT_1920752, partial [Baffinella frigidus]